MSRGSADALEVEVRRHATAEFPAWEIFHMGLSENSVPLNPMVLLIIIPIKWLFHWEYTLFSDKPIWEIRGFPIGGFHRSMDWFSWENLQENPIFNWKIDFPVDFPKKTNPLNRGIPNSWMGYFTENPSNMDDFGGGCILGKLLDYWAELEGDILTSWDRTCQLDRSNRWSNSWLVTTIWYYMWIVYM